MSREWEFEPPAGIADREVGLAVLLKQIRYELTVCQGKLSEAMRMVATLPLEGVGERVKCERCGVSLPGLNTLAEHVYHSHDGPEPEHWKRIEAMSEA